MRQPREKKVRERRLMIKFGFQGRREEKVLEKREEKKMVFGILFRVGFWGEG